MASPFLDFPKPRQDTEKYAVLIWLIWGTCNQMFQELYHLIAMLVSNSDAKTSIENGEWEYPEWLKTKTYIGYQGI